MFVHIYIHSFGVKVKTLNWKLVLFCVIRERRLRSDHPDYLIQMLHSKIKNKNMIPSRGSHFQLRQVISCKFLQ